MQYLKTAMAALIITLSSCAFAEDTIKIDNGELRGTIADGIRSFKGIPFAQPPVGELRWRAPQPIASWSGVKDASKYGPDCMQLPYRHDAAPLGVPPSEDCLYINIWTPEKSAKTPKAVMVWIYGGGFVNGGSSPPVYDGSAFARSDVVFVSFNYRLGRFGFFAHPAITAEAGDGPLANYAILDQIAALQWVKRNIAAFGGDPKNITIFGESAGGMSVHALMTSPLAKGLFEKAIIQSGGGGRAMLGQGKTLSAAEADGVTFAESKQITGTDQNTVQKLRDLSADQVIDNLNLMSLFGSTFTAPIVDGKVVPKVSVDAHRDGVGTDIPVIIGANDADGFFMEGSLDEAYAPVGPARAAAEAVYDPQNTKNAAVIGMAISADTLMIEPSRETARILANQGSEVYLYRFAYVPDYLRAKMPGALHASEIPFVFDTLSARHKELSEQDHGIAKLVHDYWVGFAKTGKPQVDGKTVWPVFNAKSDDIMQFDQSGAHVGADPLRERLDFIEGLRTAR